MITERHMFINYGEDTITVGITAYETVDVYEMLTSGSVSEPEDIVDTYPINGASNYFEIRVPAGAIWGFAVEASASYSNPDEENLTIRVADDKDPWPPPPPPPALFTSVTDFEDRYDNFLVGLSGERGERKRSRAALPAPQPAAPGEL